MGSSAVDKPRALAGIGLAIGAFALAFGLSAARIGHGAPDFYVFWTAASHWRTPYDPAIVARLEAAIHLGGVWPFAYPPTLLLIVRPFTFLPLALAYPLWTGVSAALFVFAASHVVRPPWASLALLAVPSVFFAAALGQTSLIVGAAMIGGMLTKDRRPALAGALFALAACIKPQAMLLAPIVLWGRWTVLGWMAGASAALVAASCVFGPERWAEWPRALAAFRALVPATHRINPSALIGAPWWAALMAGLGLYLAWVSRDLAGLVCGALLATSYAHAYDLAPLAPMAAAWLIERARHGWGLALLGAALLSGMVATPLAALAFALALVVLRSPHLGWRRFARRAPTLRASAP